MCFRRYNTDMTQVISKEQARYFLLQKQLLTTSMREGKKGVEEVFNKLRVVQYDPLNPCGRNPDLVLQARVDNYHPEDYYQWLYNKRKGIECYDKVLCIIPIEDYQYTAHNRKYTQEHPEIKRFLDDNKKDFEDLLKHIEKKGPVSSKDIESGGKAHGKNWHGQKQRWGKSALETLWKTGQIVIVNRINGNKYYDLPENAYPKMHFKQGRNIEAQHIKRRIGSVGIMRARGMTDAWRGVGNASEKNAIVENLLKNGELTEVEVEGVKTAYVILSEDKILIDSAPQLRDEMLFIAPLDTLIWDRQMIHDFFDFHYRWEVYVPKDKRKYGYYVLPILYKDRFVGRIEPVLQGGTLLIKNIWKEDNVEWSKEMVRKLEEAVEKFKNYLRAVKVKKLFSAGSGCLPASGGTM